MIRWALALALCALAAAGSARATEEVVAGLSQHRVALTTGFAGSEIFVYGAVRPQPGAPAPEAPLDIVVVIIGPSEPVTVRKKERQFGIWINGKGVTIDEAPSFYAVASTRALRDTVSWTDDMRHRIGLDHVIRLIDAPDWVSEREAYRQAVARVREADGLYTLKPSAVTLIEDTLFETRVRLPANLVEGDYRARIFLVRDKAVVDIFEDAIEVRRAGIGRLLYTMSKEQSALYGILSIAVALLAGWAASAFFRSVFPT